MTKKMTEHDYGVVRSTLLNNQEYLQEFRKNGPTTPFGGPEVWPLSPGGPLIGGSSQIYIMSWMVMKRTEATTLIINRRS